MAYLAGVGVPDGIDSFDAAAVAEGLRHEAGVIERLLKVLPVENQVDDDVRATLVEAAAARDHLLFYSFLVEHEDDLDRQAEEIRAEVRGGALKPGHSLEDALARFG